MTTTTGPYIDWSQAPEGYDYWIIDNKGMTLAAWHRLNKQGDFRDQHNAIWHKDRVESGRITVYRRPNLLPWTGPEDGLPPVGTECECLYYDDASVWVSTTVLFVGIDQGECPYCIVSIGQYQVIYRNSESFRLPQTERTKWIAQAESLMAATPDVASSTASRIAFANVLYDNLIVPKP